MEQNYSMRIKGERVLLGRRDMNLDQVELARRVGVSSSYIARFVEADLERAHELASPVDNRYAKKRARPAK